MHALFLALLLTVTGPEVTTPVHDLGDLAIVPVSGGFVMAWSDGPRIYAERLDADLQPVNAPFSFPLIVPSSVTSLALASNGTSVLVTWYELRGVNSAAQYAAVLDVNAQSLLAGPLFTSMGTQPAAAGVKNGKYRVLAASQLWTLDDHLGIASVEVLPDTAAAAFSPTGDAGVVNKVRTSHCNAGGFSPAFFWQACDYDEAVTFSAPAGKSGFSFQWHTYVQGPQQAPPVVDPLLHAPLIAPSGNGFIGAVATASGSNVCEVRDGGRTWAVPYDLLALAGNGSQVLAVWRDAGLRAMFLDGDAFTISEDGDVPKIVPAGSSSFVVLFRRGTSIVARRVSLQGTRGRAVR